MQRVAIAGATGFVGQALMQALSADYDLVAISRKLQSNLFSLKYTEAILKHCDTAFYLVHSMLPSVALTQGNFSDMDLICADNFARAAKTCGVRHIIYLSGLIPAERPLSIHLESRLEVEQTLASHGVPVTTLRAGLIIGAQGSSYQMMLRLVQRLPCMMMPQWVDCKTQPIALGDVITLLRYMLENPQLAGKSYDIGCPDVVSYSDMLQTTSALLGKKLLMIKTNIQAPRLSFLWISLITKTPLQLVAPLMASLRHEMLASDGLFLQNMLQLPGQRFIDAMRQALQEAAPTYLRQVKTSLPVANTHIKQVVSLQRLPLPQGRDARWVADEYARWLPRMLRPFLRVHVNAERVYRFYLPWVNTVLLELTYVPYRSSATRQLFFISGGLLVKLVPGIVGRFEFRSVLRQRYVLAAVYDYTPRLPWYIYVITQAKIHVWLMRLFGRHLKNEGLCSYSK